MVIYTYTFFLLYKIIGLLTRASSFRWCVTANQWESSHHHFLPASAPLLYKVSCLQHSNCVWSKTTSVTKASGAFYISQRDSREKGKHWKQPLWSPLCEVIAIHLPVNGNDLFRAKVFGGNPNAYKGHRRRIILRSPKTLVVGKDKHSKIKWETAGEVQWVSLKDCGH